MCIVLTTSAHSDYPFILVSNRDEYFKRPTATATFQEVDRPGDEPAVVLSPIDLAKKSKGSWIGVTKDGRLGVLVNYRNDQKHSADEPQQYHDEDSPARISRGSLVKSFLSSKLDADRWERHINKDDREYLEQLDGFSLLFGQLALKDGKIAPLSIISNKGAKQSIFSNKDSKQYVGLSNSLFQEPWPKVLMGENLLNNLVTFSMNESWSESKLVKELFKLLSFNCIKRDKSPDDGETVKKEGKLEELKMADVYNELKSSIFIPPLKTSYYNDAKFVDNKFVGNFYGTRTQTIILLKKNGTLKYIERTIHCKDTSVEIAKEIPHDINYEFNIFETGNSFAEPAPRKIQKLQKLSVDSDDQESGCADDEKSIYSEKVVVS